ncbi:MAG: hypothetical protein WC959_09245 [Kiritimatiellales bacterium]
MKKELMLAVLLFAGGGSAEFQNREWNIEGLRREAILWIPAETNNPVSVVFVFHGHGGTMQTAVKNFRIHELWPEAVIVYMQGVPTPGKLTDPDGKKSGWQNRSGIHDDRDLKFFDAVFKTLKEEFSSDKNRVYAMGHSNGGAFTYLLWSVRENLFAALAPSGSLNPEALSGIKPAPVLHIAGRTDPLVKYEWQEWMLKNLKIINKCTGESEPWDSAGDLTGTMYKSETGTPLITLIHPGGHEFPKEAPELIVKFFKQHAKAGH